jgi:hypothetical protein
MPSRFEPWEKKLLWAVGLTLLALVAYYVWPRQTLLAHRVSDADRVIFTNMQQRFSCTLTGKDVQVVVDGLSRARRVPPWYKYDCTGGYRFEFFKGSKYLGGVATGCGGLFWIGPAEYNNDDRTLDVFYERLRNEQTKREMDQHENYFRQ